MTFDPAHVVAVNRARLGLDPADEARDQKVSADSGAVHRLCVYGLMSPDGRDAHLLRPYGGTWTKVTFPGYLQNAGACIVNGECPGLAWTPNGEQNAGYLLDADSLLDAWPKLDTHEGSGMARLLTPVRAQEADQGQGTLLLANIYVSADASRAQLLMLDGMNVHDDADFRQ